MSRYYYANDIKAFIDIETNKEVKPAKIRAALELEDPNLTPAKFESFVTSLKMAPLKRSDISTIYKTHKKGAASAQDKGPSRTALLNESYERIKNELQVRFHIKDDSRIFYYIDPNNEVTPTYKEDKAGFELITVKHPDLHELLLSELNEPGNESVKNGLSFEAFMNEIYARFKVD